MDLKPSEKASTSKQPSKLSTTVQHPLEIQDFVFKPLFDLEELPNKKFSEFGVKPIDLEENFANEIEKSFDFKNQVDLEINKLRGHPKKNSGNTGFAYNPNMHTYYYSRPTPQDVLIEEHDWNQTNTSYSGFTGQLRGWWDNYISVEAKAVVINATSDTEGVDNLGMALVKIREDVVYTLVLTILEHFNGIFTNQYETLHSLLNGLRRRHLGEFLWYKDTYLSRVMELPKNGLNHWKAKFIDGLPLYLLRELKRLLELSKELFHQTFTYG
ncbi:hypothetical protein H5410_062197 [Solanum commersonii]|uniref:DUF7746 domain-containing protein n=1 Tax=Solanum commersonii TaxID=4109 RepID=A0A9J5WAU2_SOLCO|nr:hypothetical protein H5410_062197 [Solanum commersonii]